MSVPIRDGASEIGLWKCATEASKPHRVTDRVVNYSSTQKIIKMNQAIQQSKDYSRFTFINDNRLLDRSQPHIRKIAESMTKHGFIRSRAIIVKNVPNSNKLAVVDGQHRLEAAKLANVPIWYFIDNEISDEALPDIQIAKMWTPRDYVHHFVVKGKKNYIKLNEVIEKFPKAAISTILILLGGAVRTDGYKKDFQAGKLSILFLDETILTLERVMMIYTKYNFNHVLTADFTMAFTKIQRTEGYDHKIMMTRLEQRHEVFLPMVSEKGYFKLIADTYNYGGKSNRLPFKYPEE